MFPFNLSFYTTLNLALAFCCHMALALGVVMFILPYIIAMEGLTRVGLLFIFTSVLALGSYEFAFWWAGVILSKDKNHYE